LPRHGARRLHPLRGRWTRRSWSAPRDVAARAARPGAGREPARGLPVRAGGTGVERGDAAAPGSRAPQPDPPRPVRVLRKGSVYMRRSLLWLLGLVCGTALLVGLKSPAIGGQPSTVVDAPLDPAALGGTPGPTGTPGVPQPSSHPGTAGPTTTK